MKRLVEKAGEGEIVDFDACQNNLDKYRRFGPTPITNQHCQYETREYEFELIDKCPPPATQQLFKLWLIGKLSRTHFQKLHMYSLSQHNKPELSHVCGNAQCTNPFSLETEEQQINRNRDKCQNFGNKAITYCGKHAPACLLHKKRDTGDG